MALDLSFKDLADTVTGIVGMEGRPSLIPIECIDEDPDQPRRAFSDEELSQLTESIREVGILQPITIRPGEAPGRYVICMGARRYRAARLAGLGAIPAIIQEANAPDRYAQIIENIQRDDLRPSEIAAFIITQLDGGEKQAAIARKLGKPRDWISRFAAIPKMPDFLRTKLDTSSIRAVYELYQAWRVHPEAIEQACAEYDSFTDVQARRLARALRAPLVAPMGKPSVAPIALAENVTPEATASIQTEGDRTSSHVRGSREQRKSKLAVSIHVRHGGRAGRLLVESPASKGTRFAAVRFFETGQIYELPVSELSIEELAPC